MKRDLRQCFFLILAFSLAGISCQTSSEFPQFELINGEKVGIEFINKITESDTLNPVLYAYIYNGAGVGIIDVNNDGLKDLYFAGNQVSGKLYINKGNLEFEDITEAAGLITDRWCTGVAIVDINADGLQDIYLCVADKNYTDQGRNLLYINKGDNTFTESAATFGLDDPMYSTQAAFLDYDLDGDLDLYLLNNGIEDIPPNNTRPIKANGSGISTDRLYKNLTVECRGIGSDTLDCSKQFVNVSKEAGILIEGYGLGVAVSDVNQDGYPDIYCANDFITNDLLWTNNGDGTFTDKIKEYTNQTTYNGMGVDIADFNNDMLPDIVEMDMLPEDNQHTKTMLMPMNYDNYEIKLNMGYHPQFVRNTLQLNMGNGQFGEIGRLAGVHRTDWSWAPLFVDMDNDGLRDLFISNGYGRDVTDLDFVVYGMQSGSFNKPKITDKEEYEKMKQLPGIFLHNYFYKNNGDLTFSDKSFAWDLGTPSYSNGAAFADLDNDGDVDFVVNNINEHPFIYRNREEEKKPAKKKNYLRVALQGKKLSPDGWGAKIKLTADSLSLFHEHYAIRGYKSTVENTVHFGLKDETENITLEVLWPDGNRQRLNNLDANQTIVVDYKDANETDAESLSPIVNDPLFSKTESDFVPAFNHKENDFIDFKVQPLLHQMNSRTGPGMAVGDVNGDGLADFFIGGATNQLGQLFVQQEGFTFEEKTLDAEAIKKEDTGCLFFDADSDGDLDLYVASGGALFFTDGEFNEVYQDRLYLNDGEGDFSHAQDALPKINGSASGVYAADYDRDGDLDLFVGGRISPKEYPKPGKSYLLENEGGKFKDVSSEIEGLQDAGLVASALWTDVDNDGWMDLILVGEWMPLTVFKNEEGQLKNISKSTGVESLTGWWNSITGGDFDKDGDVDYIVGNLGLNSILKASIEEPVEIYAKDFDKSGNIDPVLFSYIQGKSYPVAMRDALIDQINAMKGRFKTYAPYAKATKNEVFTEQELEGAIYCKATTLAHTYFENVGNGQFTASPLPNSAQIAPIYGMQVADFNQDGNIDVLAVGNNTNVETLYGYYDASPGILLLGNGNGNFSPETPLKSGLNLKGNARSLTYLFDQNDKKYLLIGKNNEALQALEQNNTSKKVKLSPNDAYALLYFTGNRKVQKVEFYYGEGYLSQNERKLLIPFGVEKVEISDYQGKSRSINPNSL